MADNKAVHHWADQIVKEIKERIEKDPSLKEMTEKYGFIVYDEKTPSGKIHIGSGRGWIIHDVVAKAMRDAGLNARFILSSDDMDPLDKMNSDMDADFEKYMGVPFRYIPSPVKGYDSFADYYFKQVTNKFDEFGIEAEFESTGEEYEKGTFNEQIKIALDNAEKIKEIYSRLYGDTIGSKRLPFNPICEKCGKIATTIATGWDPDKEMLTYECRDDIVPWAKGCGHKGERSPYNGGGKFPWKVEWAAKWPAKKVIYEVAGKDHFTKGGSRTCAIAIANEVFDFHPPYPSNRYATGKGYEFFTVGGKKMSTSKGRGLGFAESTDYAPATMLRFLLVKTRPHTTIDFDPYNGNDLILLYDRYDKTERIYFKVDEADETTYQNNKRIYELSHVGPIWDTIPPQVALSHLAIIAQIAPDSDKAIELLQKTGHLKAELNEKEKTYVENRIKFAMNWVKEFAPEQYKFELKSDVEGITVDDNQKKALKEFIEAFSEEIIDKELHDRIYDIAKSNDIKPPEFFKLCYNILIGKDRGPKLASFVLMIKDKAKDLFLKLV